MNDFIEQIKINSENNPNSIAVIQNERRISYKDFFILYNSYSHYLKSIGDKPKIVFDLNQSIESYALIIACFNIGGTFCPLNPDAPIERKEMIIAEFNPDVIIVENQDQASKFKNQVVKVTLNTISPDRNLKAHIQSHNGEDIVYVIYTSGSTGKPKGVLICRKAVNKFLEWSIPTYQATEKDIWGQFSLLSFDLSIVDILTCLCSGAALFVMNDAPSKLRPSSFIEKNKITIWHSTPGAVDIMIKGDKPKAYDLSSLRLMSFCGEPLRKHQVEFLFTKNSNLTIFNTYGPTEGTLFCSWQELKSDNFLNYSDTTMCIGKPIPGWEFSLNPIQDSEEKEIIIYGDYIGKGYVENSTQDKFKEIEIKGQKVNAFESGDLVIEKNGNLFFSCRKDRQVKIKGYRIELDEIDFWNNDFLKKPSVTIAINDVLYTFIESDEEINEAELRVFLEKKIEAFKIPRFFMVIKEIPRNPNLKVNINTLANLI